MGGWRHVDRDTIEFDGKIEAKELSAKKGFTGQFTSGTMEIVNGIIVSVEAG